MHQSGVVCGVQHNLSGLLIGAPQSLDFHVKRPLSCARLPARLCPSVRSRSSVLTSVSVPLRLPCGMGQRCLTLGTTPTSTSSSGVRCVTRPLHACLVPGCPPAFAPYLEAQQTRQCAADICNLCTHCHLLLASRQAPRYSCWDSYVLESLKPYARPVLGPNCF